MALSKPKRLELHEPSAVRRAATLVTSIACSRRGLFIAFAGVLVAATSSFGCGYLRASSARQYMLAQELDAYVIPKPIEVTWAKVGEVRGPYDNLFWNGQSILHDVGPYLKKSDARTTTSKSRKTQDTQETIETSVISCEGKSLPNGSQILYYEDLERTSKSPGVPVSTQHTHERRFDLELELIEMFDPASAARIRASVEDAAKSGEWAPKMKTPAPPSASDAGVTPTPVSSVVDGGARPTLQ